MRLSTAAAVALVMTWLAGTLEAAEPRPGSADFVPSAKSPVGWRGDGTGKYPDATPPVNWGRSLKQLGDLRCSASVPADGGAKDAAPTSGGYFTEWLVGGPVTSPGPAQAIKGELIPGEAALAPVAGDKVADGAWQVVKADGFLLDLWKVLGALTKEQAVFAQSCLYTEKPLKIWLTFKCGLGGTVWLNGKQIHTVAPGYQGAQPTTLELDLRQGWNRFLFKVAPYVTTAEDFVKGCYITCTFWPSEGPRDFVERNVSWIAPMPGLSQAMPIVVGDRIYTTAHPYNLVCLDKMTGKMLWVRSNSPYDAATEEDRKAKPELFAKLDALAARRNAYYDGFVAGKLPSALAVRDETDLENEMDKLMAEVDARYQRPWQQGEPDWWTIPTPTSDGRCVSVWLTRGVSASYDLDGKRRWIRYIKPKNQHHGYFTSPVIADGKFVFYDGRLTALDLADGSARWSIDDTWHDKHESPLWFGSLGRAVFNDAEYVLWLGTDMVRARDGRQFPSKPWRAMGDSSPVFEKDVIFQAYYGTNLSPYRVKAADDGGVTVQQEKGITWPGKDLLGAPNFYQGHWLEASPLVHDGLGYVVSCSGVLAVFDVATMQRVYEKVLPVNLNGYFGTSPTLAGEHIYLMGSGGTCLVIKPGRTYEEIARNTVQSLCQAAFHLEGQRTTYRGHTLGNYSMFLWNPKYCPEAWESTMTSTPVFDGKRMYFRGQENLYCVEEK